MKRRSFAAGVASWMAAGLLASATSPLARGQCPSGVYSLSGPGWNYGASLANVGDVDGDSVADLAVGSPALPGPVGLVEVRSGASGALLFSIPGQGPTAPTFGWSLAGIGDLSGDGTPDFAVGAPWDGSTPSISPGTVSVRSGADGSALTTLSGTALDPWFGRAVAGPGDLDGDGVPDVVVGASGSGQTYGSPGSVTALSGSTGSVLFALSGAVSGVSLGWTVVVPGDLDGDGGADLVAGAPVDPSLFPASTGTARAISGANGLVLYSVSGGSDVRFGLTAASVGDVGGDGIGDFAMGSYSPPVGPGAGYGYFRVHSGADGALAFQVPSTGFAAGGFATSIAGVGDVDGDGVPDVVAGTPSLDGPTLAWPSTCTGSWEGRFQVLSGTDGSTLATVLGTVDEFSLGRSVAALGDVSGDGNPDVAVGRGGGNVGVYTLGGGTPTAVFGSGCPGVLTSVPFIGSGGGCPQLGNGLFRIALWGADSPPSPTGLLILGVSNTGWAGFPLPLNLGFAGLPACSLLVSFDVSATVPVTGCGGSTGIASLLVPIPPNPALAGATVYAQWMVFGPPPWFSPMGMTAGLQITLG